MKTCSIRSVLHHARERLKSVSDSPSLDAEILLAHCMQKNRTYLHTWPEKQLDDKQQDCFQGLIKRRLNEYPLAYLTAKKAFWTLDLWVTPDVLIPRPETELLVETALEKIASINNPKILDLGTGSGAIALALAVERNDARIVATDNSAKALAVARKNAQQYKLEERTNFLESDWFSQVTTREFDLIVSNPPYIAPDDPHLQQSIRHEPMHALVAPDSGLKDIKTIINNSPRFLKNKGWIILEHGYQQSSETLALLKQNHLTQCYTLQDLSGNPRVTLSQKP